MSNITSDFIRVKGVNPKPKYPKFNSGSLLLDNEKWINVAKSVDIQSFQKDNTYAVDIETNDKGYKTVIKNKTIEEGSSVPVKTAPRAEKKDDTDTKMTKSDWAAKDRSQMIGGLMHDAAALVAASIPGHSLDDQLKQVKDTVLGLLKIRDEVQ